MAQPIVVAALCLLSLLFLSFSFAVAVAPIRFGWLLWQAHCLKGGFWIALFLIVWCLWNSVCQGILLSDFRGQSRSVRCTGLIMYLIFLPVSFLIYPLFVLMFSRFLCWVLFLLILILYILQFLNKRCSCFSAALLQLFGIFYLFFAVLIACAQN